MLYVIVRITTTAVHLSAQLCGQVRAQRAGLVSVRCSFKNRGRVRTRRHRTTETVPPPHGSTPRPPLASRELSVGNGPAHVESEIGKPSARRGDRSASKMKSTDLLLGIPATHHGDDTAAAIFKEEEQQQQQQQQPRSTSRSKKIALLGGLRGMIARSRPSGNKDKTAAAGSSSSAGTTSPDLFAEDAQHLAANTGVNVINREESATCNNIIENSPPRHTFSAASWPKAAAAPGNPASGRNQCGGRQSHQGSREDNFHAAMDNRLVHMAFSSFCNKTLSLENVEFVLQVSERAGAQRNPRSYCAELVLREWTTLLYGLVID